MTLAELLPFFAQTGVFGAVVWAIYHMHKDAVAAHDKRATEWQQVAVKEATRNDELQDQIMHILGAVKTSTTTAGAP